MSQLQVFKVNDISFTESITKFQIKMAKETENMLLDPETVQRGVQKIINNPETGFYLGAIKNGELVASLLVLYEWSDWRCKNVIWIHSLYVIPSFRQQGIFSSMYQFLKSIVEESDQDYAGIRLYVEKDNELAKEVYIKKGMSNQHYDLFEWLVEN